MYEQRVDLMHKVFWDEEAGAWFDHLLSDRSARKRFFPSNVFPLFVGCYSSENSNIEEKVFRYLVVRKLY